MGIVNTVSMVCDRCGKSIPVESDSFTMCDLRSGQYPGWISVSNSRILCPECSPGYDLLLAKHKVELENYITNE